MAALAAEVHAKTLLIEKLRMQLSILRRARGFGRSSAKLDREIEQLELFARRHRGERRQATGANRSFPTWRGFFLPAVEEAIRPQASAPDHLPLETVMHEAPSQSAPFLRRNGKLEPDRL